MFRMCGAIPVLLLHAIMAWTGTKVIMTRIINLDVDDDGNTGSNS